jgi:hypothetical protein
MIPDHCKLKGYDKEIKTESPSNEDYRDNIYA